MSVSTGVPFHIHESEVRQSDEAPRGAVVTTRAPSHAKPGRRRQGHEPMEAAGAVEAKSTRPPRLGIPEARINKRIFLTS